MKASDNYRNSKWFLVNPRSCFSYNQYITVFFYYYYYLFIDTPCLNLGFLLRIIILVVVVRYLWEILLGFPWSGCYLQVWRLVLSVLSFGHDSIMCWRDLSQLYRSHCLGSVRFNIWPCVKNVCRILSPIISISSLLDPNVVHTETSSFIPQFVCR